jgi:hypothetical protein
MRTQKSRGVLSEHRIKLLEQTGFKWNAQITQNEEMWEERCRQLLDYKDRYGHCNGPTQWKENPQLGRWALYQRQMKRSGKIHPQLEEKLNALGFDWGFKINLDSRRLHDTWSIRYDELLEFRSLNNHCNVPARWSENPELGGWVIRQRRLKKSSQILLEREKLLNEIGFTWQLVDRSEGPSGSERISSLESSERLATSWKRMFDELVCYREAHGNFDVPVKWEANPQLGMWTAAQRSLGKSGRLRPDRKQMLDGIDFDWRTECRKEDWAIRLEQLREYKERLGDCNVPVRWPENKQLGMWVAAQRTMRKSGKLQQNREKLLSEIGFEWRVDSHNEEWVSRLDQLKAYRERFGNCRVPMKWAENPQLGAWVTNQRYRLNNGTLSPERARLLNEIGL